MNRSGRRALKRTRHAWEVELEADAESDEKLVVVKEAKPVRRRQKLPFAAPQFVASPKEQREIHEAVVLKEAWEDASAPRAGLKHSAEDDDLQNTYRLARRGVVRDRVEERRDAHRKEDDSERVVDDEDLPSKLCGGDEQAKRSLEEFVEEAELEEFLSLLEYRDGCGVGAKMGI